MSLAVLATTPRRHTVGEVGRRAPHDFYPTPPEAVRALLSVETFDGSIWEPACGNGAISKVLIAAGHDVVSTDLVDYRYGSASVDFLNQRRMRGRHIVTNPPYGSGLADAFVKHALGLSEQTGGSVAMLLNLASLCHPSRHELWTAHPPAAIYALDQLVCWPSGRSGIAGFHHDKQKYCWVVWHSGHAGPTRFGWLSPGQFV
jgi:hypothetical protein